MTTTRLAVHAGSVEPAGQDGPRDGWLLLVVEDPDEAEIAEVDRVLGLPAQVSRTVHGPHLRPRLERHDECLSVVLKAARLVEETSDVELGELLVLLTGDTAAIVARDTPGIVADVLDEAAQGLPVPGALLVAVLDVLLPDFDEVLAGLDDDVAEVEVRVFSAERGDHTRTIYRLKRELLELRRAVAPLVDVVDRLRDEPACAFPDDLSPALTSQRDRLVRTADSVDHLDRLIDGVLDAQLAQIGVRQNEDQRKISAWAAIALVPTVVGGVYGMNFEHMPELGWEYGYVVALAVILSACLALYAGFRRNGWL